MLPHHKYFQSLGFVGIMAPTAKDVGLEGTKTGDTSTDKEDPTKTLESDNKKQESKDQTSSSQKESTQIGSKYVGKLKEMEDMGLDATTNKVCLSYVVHFNHYWTARIFS